MTMADSIAVMNGGVIEQLGAPEDLYDNPATTFVSNFLGQSNLVRGQVRGKRDRVVEVEVHGTRVWVPEERCRSAEGEVWVGVRPEKVYLGDVGTDPGADTEGTNDLKGGTVSDVSFIGVSTQYLVRMPWGQELTVFEQNSGARGAFRPGDQVELHWRAGHTFLLDADQDVHAGEVVE